MNDNVKCECMPTDAIAALLLRWAVASLLFFAGLNKFLGEGGVFGSVQMISGGFKDTYLPMFLVLPFAYTIPFAEVVLGVLLFLGLMTRASLLASGLFMLGLQLGVLVLKNMDAIFPNTMYVALIVAALWFASRDNRYSVDRLIGIR